MSERIFVSSVQKELAAERQAIRDYIRGDALLRRFFEVFLFEDLPASDRRADDAYLGEVSRSAVYVGIFGNEYGNPDDSGLAPTEREFAEATALGKTRLIFVKGAEDKDRHPKMRALIGKAGAQLIRRRFRDIAELKGALYASLVGYLEIRGVIQNAAFEDRPCPGATLNDIHKETVTDFVRRAHHERQFPLPERAPVADVLAHLHLLNNGEPSNAALLLFGRDPQRFTPQAEVRCMHFHGTEVQRPAPSYQVFKGSLFDQVDRAADFVLSVINRSIGTRSESARAPVVYEIPPDVVRESIVNAVAHRDYASAGSVQVSVFSDRVEVWNPGALPPPLTPERLRQPHGSIPRNPRVAEALFLTRYIERFGTGILMMIRECAARGLAEPDFVQQGEEFVTVVWRDWLTERVVAALELNERQRNAILHLKLHVRITNRGYQQLTGASERTALRDLSDLQDKGVVTKRGQTGRSTHYTLAAKPATNPPNPPVAERDYAVTKGHKPRSHQAKPNRGAP